MIKNILFTMVLLIMCCCLATGQMAIRAGINTSEIRIKDGNIDISPKTGIQVGMTYTAKVTDRISFRPGAIFSVKGYKSLTETGDLSYLEVPASFIFGILGDFLYAEVGPYAGVLITSDKISDISFKNLDFGLNIGGGINIGRFGIGITYGYGLASIHDGDFTTQGTTARNSNVGVFGTVSF